MPRIEFEPLQNLFESDSAVPKELMKKQVVEDFKQTELIGVPDSCLEISFSPGEGDDILIRRVDPENALGYSVYPSEEDYFDHLSASLYQPTDEEILGGTG